MDFKTLRLKFENVFPGSFLYFFKIYDNRTIVRKNRSDYKDQKGNQLTWQKIFTPNKKLLEEIFTDILNKTNIKYNLSNENIRFLKASIPRGTVIYNFS